MYVNRTTLPSDFAMMEKAGLHFKVVRSRQNKYYFDARLFDIQAISIQDKNSVNGRMIGELIDGEEFDQLR
jgi:hypothetical protein